eukprot:XP_011413056.1 PREDICTED: retinol-binding protein 4-A-like [Crassostrea gigas]
MFRLPLAMVSLSCLFQSLVASNCTLRVDSLQAEANFSTDMYVGQWYGIKWFTNRYVAPEQIYRDFTQELSRRQDGNLTMTYHGRDPVNSQGCIQFYSTVYLTDTPGKFRLDFQDHGNFVDYWVVKTDYTNYSVVYECIKLNDDNTCKKIITWVFSRHQTLPDSLMAEVDHVIENMCLNETQFYTTTYSKSCSDSTSA